jgi:hypothetical protein
MPYRIERDPETEIVYIVFHGDVTMDDVRVAAEKAWQLADADGGYRFLSEFENARLQLSTQDLVSIHKHYEEIGVRKYMKSAIVVPQDAAIAGDATVHEYMANMDMWQVRVFFDRNQALKWLMS